MEIRKVQTGKERYAGLLLLADEQWSMVERYLHRGDMYVLDDGGVKSECIVTDEGGGVLEIKSLATLPAFQGRGYGKALIEFVAHAYADRYEILQVGTGEPTVPFYQRCGFQVSHRAERFFLEFYDHPILEDGVQLVDMVYLRRKLKSEE